MYKRSTILAITILSISLSCGNDDSPTGANSLGEGDDNPVLSTPEEVFDALEKAYNNRDLKEYEALLDENYRFHFVPSDGARPSHHDVWKADEELACTENMFSGVPNPDNKRVRALDLRIVAISTVLDSSDHDGAAPGETWYDVDAEINLIVTVLDSSAGYGGETRNHVVFSGQIFTLRPDPTREGNLLIVEQRDREPITRSRPGAQWSEDAQWGALKAMFRYTQDEGVVSQITELLEEDFKTVYNGKDSLLYATLLDTRYEFENLPADPDNPLSVETWDRGEEMKIADRMFSGWETPEGKQVLDIDLKQTVQSVRASTTEFEDRPDGETWYLANTQVDLVILVRYHDGVDGDGLVNKVIFSGQKYWLRPKEGGAGGWAIRRQVDEDPITKSAAAATQEASWGSVKGLFR